VSDQRHKVPIGVETLRRTTTNARGFAPVT
jgi:hypothetical protein